MRTNEDRALEGAMICQFLESLTGTDDTQDQVADTICQLMHFCHVEKHDFARAVQSAQMNFNAEIDEEKRESES